MEDKPMGWGIRLKLAALIMLSFAVEIGREGWFRLKNVQRFQRRAPSGALVLYGDGDHNDAAALYAWQQGKPVAWPTGRLVSNRLDGYTFRVDSEWVVPYQQRDPRRRMEENTFIGTYSSSWFR